MKQHKCEIKPWAGRELLTLAVNTDYVPFGQRRHVCLLYRHDDVFVRIPRDIALGRIVELGGDLLRQAVDVVWGVLVSHEQQQITPPRLTEEMKQATQL